MRRRPWPILLLALAHIFAPFANILYSAWLRKAGLHYYVMTTFVLADNKWESALYLLGFPIAGVAIYKTNRWSYPIYLIVLSSMLVANFITWRQFPQYFGLASLIFSYVINLSVVSYFLIPAVRNVYFNPKIRWWEVKPRYDVNFQAQATMGEITVRGEIQNISEGGIFLQTDSIFLSGNEIEVSFPAREKQFNLKGKVVYARTAPPPGYGIQLELSPADAKEIKALVKILKHEGAHERVGNLSAWQEFKSWFVTAVSTGKGLVPQSKPDSKA